MLSNKAIQQKAAELFFRDRKLNTSLVSIAQSYFVVP